MTRPTMYAPTTAYRVGRATENKARAVLHGLGFVTLRSWMSRSPADIVALRQGNTPLLVQVKKGGVIGPGERAALLAMAQVAGAVPVLCRMEPDGSLSFHRMTGSGPRDFVPVDLEEDVFGAAFDEVYRR